MGNSKIEHPTSLFTRGLRRAGLCAVMSALAFGGACAAPIEGAPGEGEQDGEEQVAAVSEALSGVTYSVGWVWASNPTYAGSYAPYSNYSYNFQGGANRITRLGTGRYRVDMGKLRAPGNAQVVAYGSDSNRCQLYGAPYNASYNSVTGARFDVVCTNYRGDVADSMFVAFYQNGGDYDGEIGFTTVSASGVRSTNDSAHVTGSTKTATGRYLVSLDSGMTGGQQNVLLTAMGSNGAYCVNLGNRPLIAGGPPRMEVRCYSKTGAPMDNAFSFLFMREPQWADVRSVAATTANTFDHSTNGWYSSSQSPEMVYFDYGNLGSIAASFYDVGMKFPTTALVTAKSGAVRYCKPAGWWHDDATTNATLNVACFDQNGVAAGCSVSTLFAGQDKYPAIILPLN